FMVRPFLLLRHFSGCPSKSLAAYRAPRFLRSGATAGGAARIALLTCSVAHHREVLALGANVAGVALGDRAHAAFVLHLLGFRLGGSGVGCGLVGEEGGGRLALFGGHLFQYFL